MTALAADRDTQKQQRSEIRFYPIADNVKIYKGAIVALSGGYAQPATTAPGLAVAGRARKQYDNTVGGHALAALTVEVEEGYFKYANGDSIVQADVGKDAYLVDDQTVSKGAAGKSRAGTIVGVDTDGVWVQMAAGGSESAADKAKEDAMRAGMGPRQARGAVTANVASLAAFTVSQDGVTYVAGDIVLLVGQTTKSQNGLYVVGTVAGTAPLTRSVDFATGTAIPGGAIIEVSEGTLFAQTTWKLTTAGGIVAVDTTAHDWYPRFVSSSRVLVAGTVTISDIPLLSATKSMVSYNRTTPNTTASTIIYSASTMTPGVVGTASIVFQAQVAAGTINAADISTLNVSVTNW